jgi:hypothetical protein
VWAGLLQVLSISQIINFKRILQMMKLELLRCISSFVFFFLSKSKTDDAAEEAMNKMFKILCSQENDNIRPKTFTHFGRNISFAITCGQVLDSTFDELCDRVRDNWNVTCGDDFLVIFFIFSR